jgi:hypothetical protein
MRESMKNSYLFTIVGEDKNDPGKIRFYMLGFTLEKDLWLRVENRFEGRKPGAMETSQKVTAGTEAKGNGSHHNRSDNRDRRK